MEDDLSLAAVEGELELDPTTIARTRFPVVARGFDQGAVLTFLNDVSVVVARLYVASGGEELARTRVMAQELLDEARRAAAQMTACANCGAKSANPPNPQSNS
jgi:hypothetical protein